jgi:hypothetical protein
VATPDTDPDDPTRWGVLASALSGRTLQVAPVGSGEPAWTDGNTVFVATDTGTRVQLQALIVQAALLAAGSLNPDVVRKLARRPAVTRRYLAVEGHRALAAIEPLLPRFVRSLIDPDLASRTDSPTASLASALGRETIPDPPHSFGTIRTRRLVASIERAAASPAIREQSAREQREDVPAALDGAEDDFATDLFSSPAGGGGVFGRLLSRMLATVRRLESGGLPAGDARSRWTRGGTRGSDVPLSTERARSTDAARNESRTTK